MISLGASNAKLRRAHMERAYRRTLQPFEKIESYAVLALVVYLAGYIRLMLVDLPNVLSAFAALQIFATFLAMILVPISFGGLVAVVLMKKRFNDLLLD